MVHIIYMAAGNSRRFGSNKLLYIWQGKMLYKHTLDMLSDIVRRRKENVDKGDGMTLTVVTQYDSIIADLEGRKDINTVFCGDSRLGASYTIKAGIKSLKGRLKKDDWLLFVVADQPYLGEKTILKFIEAAGQKHSRLHKVFSARYKEKVGNPCMFSCELIPELLELSGDSGGRKVAKRHECFYIDVDDVRELFDIDTVLDL